MFPASPANVTMLAVIPWAIQKSAILFNIGWKERRKKVSNNGVCS
jgi:hypothetical protein